MLPILSRSQSPGYHSGLQTQSSHLRLRPLPVLYVAMTFCSPETYILFFEFVCFIFYFYILSFIGTETMCQCIHKCTIPLDLKIPLTSIFQKLIDTFNLVLSSHPFYLTFKILYPSSYSGVQKERTHTKLFKQLSFWINSHMSEPVFLAFLQNSIATQAVSIFPDNVKSESSLESKEGIHLEKWPCLMGDPELLLSFILLSSRIQLLLSFILLSSRIQNGFFLKMS